MVGFTGAVLSFPAVWFSLALLLVIAYWVLVLAGGIGHSAHGGVHAAGHAAAGDAAGHGGVLGALGLGGVPGSIALSLVVAFAWFSALAARLATGPGTWGAVAVALAGPLGGLLGARLLVWPLRRLLPQPVPPPSRLDFVGRRCVIRTGRVGPGFGQAEVHADDGSAALVQVRQSAAEAAGGGSGLTSGATALLYAYDPDGEFFRVMPDVAPWHGDPAAPHRPPH